MRISVNGVELAVHEWPGSGPPILLCHATGFHARCWNRVVEALPGRHVLALDFRGHGLSSKPPAPYAWRTMGEDLAELTRALGLKGAIGAGHSMGGHALTLAAAANPDAFTHLVLLDPVILPASDYRGSSEPLGFVSRRKNEWLSPQEMIDRFRDRAPFKSWHPGVLEDYCNFGLEGSHLACPPDVEASIYANSSAVDANPYQEVGQVDAHVLVVRSRTPYTYGSFDASPTAPELASHFRNGRDELCPQFSHFIPMEGPGWVADRILTYSA